MITQDNILPTVVLDTASGAIVDSATFLIDGNTEMNASVSITNQSGSVVGSGVASGTGTFSIAATLIQDSENVLTVTATDAAGNQSSGALTVTEDSIANTLLIQALPAATNASTVNIEGTTKANSILTLVHSGGLTQTGVTVTGTFSLPVSLIANSINSISLSSQDQVGNVATGSVTITQDTMTPVVTLGTLGVTTSALNFTLTGTTEPLASIVISGGSGASVGGVADALGSFSISVPLQMDLVNTLLVTASDLAGNTGTGGVAITQDSVPLTLVLSPLASTVTNTNTLTLSGTSKVGAAIAVTGSGSANTTVDNFGNFSVNVALIANGLNQFTVTATDATNAPLAVTTQITQDSIAPTLALTNSTGATSLLTFAITGTTEIGATVQAMLVGTGAFTGAMTAIGTSTGAFSLTIPLLANTGATLGLTAVDAAGNTSTGVIFTLTQDNLAPAIGAQSFSGSTINGVTVGTYQFTTNETTQSTLYVGTGSNVLGTLIWSGSTNGLSHSGTIVGVQPDVSYSTFVRAIDAFGNTTDSTVAPVVFTTSTTTGGTSGGSFVSSGGGGGGGGGGGSITIGIGGLVPSSTPTNTASGTTTSPVTPPSTTQSGSTTSTGTTTAPTKTQSGTTTTPVKKPIVSKPTPSKPVTGKPTPEMPTPGNTLTPPSKGTVVEGPGFNYAIVDKNYTSPTGPDSLNDFQPGVRFISASNSVKVRTTRNVQSNLVDILPRNSRVLLVEVKDGWGKIEVR